MNPKWKRRLIDFIKNRRWERHSDPFNYVYAQGVFFDDFYKKLEDEFRAIADRGLDEKPTVQPKFSRSMSGYDAYGAGMNETTTGEMTLFLSPEWHDMMAALFNVRGTGYINAGMHYHTVGSESGFIHNDLNPVWFPTIEGSGRIRHANHGICSYKTGAGPLGPDQKIEVVRGVVMIFYLNNGDWREGYGGETGFYTDHLAPVTEWVKKIPPYDNSLIMYECTPHTWHTFLTNTKKPRSSIIMWIHRPLEEAQELFGDKNLERWGPEHYLALQK